MPLCTRVLTVVYILNGCSSATLCTKQDLSYHFRMYCLWHCHTLYKIGPVLSFQHVLPVVLPHSVQSMTCLIIYTCIAFDTAPLCPNRACPNSCHFRMCCMWHCHTVQNRTCPIISTCVACGTATLYKIGPVLSFPRVACGTATLCTKQDLSYHFRMCCLWRCNTVQNRTCPSISTCIACSTATLYKIGPVLLFLHVLPVALPHFVQNRTCPSISACVACGTTTLCTEQDLSQHFRCAWPGFELACGEILQHLVTLLMLLCGMRCVECVCSGSEEHSLWKLIWRSGQLQILVMGFMWKLI